MLPFLHTEFFQVPVRQTSSLSSSPTLFPHFCEICGDVSSGFHCGAFICEACKKFFVRSLRLKTGFNAQCLRGGNCIINKETRTQCPRCRFNKCLSLNMYGPGGPNVSEEINLIPCKVCGAPSSGFHFGAITCEGCKGFYRRCIKERDVLKYQCNQGGTCEVTWKTRNLCKYCRYKKCYDIGMTPTKSRIGRQPNLVKHKTQLEVNHFKKAHGSKLANNERNDFQFFTFNKSNDKICSETAFPYMRERNFVDIIMNGRFYENLNDIKCESFSNTSGDDTSFNNWKYIENKKEQREKTDDFKNLIHNRIEYFENKTIVNGNNHYNVHNMDNFGLNYFERNSNNGKTSHINNISCISEDIFIANKLKNKCFNGAKYENGVGKNGQLLIMKNGKQSRENIMNQLSARCSSITSLNRSLLPFINSTASSKLKQKELIYLIPCCYDNGEPCFWQEDISLLPGKVKIPQNKICSGNNLNLPNDKIQRTQLLKDICQFYEFRYLPCDLINAIMKQRVINTSGNTLITKSECSSFGFNNGSLKGETSHNQCTQLCLTTMECTKSYSSSGLVMRDSCFTYSQIRNLMMHLYKLLEPVTKISPSRVFRGMNQEEVWDAQMSKFTCNAIYIIEFAKNVPGFSTFALPVKIDIIQRCMYPIVVFMLSKVFNSLDDSLLYFGFFKEEKEIIHEKFFMFKNLEKNLLDVRIISKTFGLDEIETVFLCAIHLIDLGGSHDYKELLIDSLQFYVKERYGEKSLRHQNILRLLRLMTISMQVHNECMTTFFTHPQFANIPISQSFIESFKNLELNS